MAKLIADEVPFKHRADIIRIGEDMGEGRMIAGAHYPTEKMRITSSGDITIAAGGDIETSTTGKIKMKGSFMQSSTHQALTLGY